LYQEVFDANRRLCERLGVDEDKDIEHLINNMQDIAKILAMKMFDYGMRVQQEATVSERRENE
jgi:predicted site-specific integrase-resolvase